MRHISDRRRRFDVTTCRDTTKTKLCFSSIHQCRLSPINRYAKLCEGEGELDPPTEIHQVLLSQAFLRVRKRGQMRTRFSGGGVRLEELDPKAGSNFTVVAFVYGGGGTRTLG